MTKPFDYAGKVAFVAGGSSGINLGIAKAFAAAGARVAIASRSQQRVDAAVDELLALGTDAAGYTPMCAITRPSRRCCISRSNGSAMSTC